jgi:hypothetical protein
MFSKHHPTHLQNSFAHHPVISASSALCTLIALLFALSTLVDSQHRIRLDRLDSRKPIFYRLRDAAGQKIWRGVRRLACCGRRSVSDEREPLLAEAR